MGRQGRLIGEVAARTGVSRKALRLYEALEILPKPARTRAGYRLYGDEALGVLGFVAQARRLGFSLTEIKEIAAIRRSGRMPCAHVQALLRRKVADLGRTLEELTAVRKALRALLTSWQSRPSRSAAVCPHIEAEEGGKQKWSR